MDVSYQYLQFFLESDEELAQIKADYNSGKLLTGELKSMCVDHLQKYVGAFQDRRAKVTDAVVEEFMTVRPLEWKGNPRVPRADLVPATKPGEGGNVDGAAGGDGGSGKLTKNQMKKLLKEQQVAQKKADKAREKADKAAALAAGA